MINSIENDLFVLNLLKYFMADLWAWVNWNEWKMARRWRDLNYIWTLLLFYEIKTIEIWSKCKQIRRDVTAKQKWA